MLFRPLAASSRPRTSEACTINTSGFDFRQGPGAPAPKNVAIVEWDSVDDAVAFYKSKAWTDLAQREKAQKTIRRYVVELEK